MSPQKPYEKTMPGVNLTPHQKEVLRRLESGEYIELTFGAPVLRGKGWKKRTRWDTTQKLIEAGLAEQTTVCNGDMLPNGQKHQSKVSPVMTIVKLKENE